MREPITIPATRYTCEVCGFVWISVLDKTPEFCKNRICRSRKWNGGKKIGHPFGGRDTSNNGLPKPKKVRNLE